MATKRDFTTTYGLQSDKSGAGTNTLVVDSVNDRVGISTSPLDTLHVQGTFRIDRQLTAQDQAYIRFFRQGTEKGRLGLISADNGIFINGSASDSANHLVITSDGNLGVGTSNPFSGSFGSFGLDVNRANCQIHARNIGTTDSASVWASDQDYFSGATYKGVAIRKYGTTTSGNVFGSLPNADLGNVVFQNVANALIYTNGQTPIIFGTFSQERMRIEGLTGNMGVANSNPWFKLDIGADARITSTNKLRFGGTTTTTNFYIQYNSSTNSLDFVAG